MSLYAEKAFNAVMFFIIKMLSKFGFHNSTFEAIAGLKTQQLEKELQH